MPPTRLPSGAPVPVGGEAARFHEGRRRWRIDHPAGDRDAVLGALHLDLRLVHQCGIPDRGPVHEGEVGEIEQVVDDELPVAFDVKVLTLGAPVRIVEPVEIGDLVGIGKRGIAHPNPQPVVALDHGIALDPRRARNRVLAGHPHAGAGLVVAQAVIVALQHVADQCAHGER